MDALPKCFTRYVPTGSKRWGVDGPDSDADYLCLGTLSAVRDLIERERWLYSIGYLDGGYASIRKGPVNLLVMLSEELFNEYEYATLQMDDEEVPKDKQSRVAMFETFRENFRSGQGL